MFLEFERDYPGSVLPRFSLPHGASWENATVFVQASGGDLRLHTLFDDLTPIQGFPGFLVLPCPQCRDPSSPRRASTPTTLLVQRREPGGNPPSSIRSIPSLSSIPTGMVSETSMASIQNSTISGIWALTSCGCHPYTSPHWRIWAMTCMQCALHYSDTR